MTAESFKDNTIMLSYHFVKILYSFHTRLCQFNGIFINIIKNAIIVNIIHII
jgi:hypothetical protein